MAISNYTELKTAVSNWTDRDDLDDRIPEFIALAEARLNRNLRIRSMEVKQKANTVPGQRALSLPPRYIQMRNFQINSGGKVRSIEYVTPEIFDLMHGNNDQGRPCQYSIVSGEVQLGPIPDSEYEAEMLFYQSSPPLSASNPTNWFTTFAPDVLLYGALLEAEPFIMNDNRIQLWKQAFDAAVVDMQDQDNRDRHSGSQLRVRHVYA
jgi:hypothetical protein